MLTPATMIMYNPLFIPAHLAACNSITAVALLA